MRRLSIITLAVGLLSTAGCPAGSGIPGGPDRPDVPGRGGSKVDPNTCGNYAATDLGKKIQLFLKATVALDAAVYDLENYTKDTCVIMGKELAMSGLDGDTRTVCSAVAKELEAHLQAGIKAEAELAIDYQPAVCRVDVNVAAEAAAQCEGKASAEVKAQCNGGCSGTCNGTCDGKCKGGTGGSACNGECDGVCRGECSGTCDGSADVDAEASCRAHAAVEANVEAECTPAEVTVSYDNKIVVDKTKLEAAERAIKAGLPRLILIHHKATGPVAMAVTVWAKSAGELAEAGRGFFSSLGDQALCVSGQIAAAFEMLGRIQGSLSVSVEVSVEVSGSAGASI